MPSLVIKTLPPDLHQSLKSAAHNHQRSMTQEALLALRLGLASEPLSPQAALASLPAAFKPKLALRDKDLSRMKRLGLR